MIRTAEQNLESTRKRHSLSWGLVIATYRHESILPICLKLAAEQTRRPKEIIVVDASEYWQETKKYIKEKIAVFYPEIRWVYVDADYRSTAMQRNQGVYFATADILFLLDDDSLMYSTCAEEIMQIYEADPEGTIQGVQASLAAQPPYTNAPKLPQSNWFTHLIRRCLDDLLLTKTELLCIPYEQNFPKYEIPLTVQHFNAHLVKILQGCRMTFRRSVIATERFEPLLLYYAIYEDMDASYRVSRHGALVESVEAKIYHAQNDLSHISRCNQLVLSALNQVFFLKKNSDNLNRDRLRFYLLMLRRLVAEFIKDIFNQRWSLPQVRGLLIALKYSLPMFAMHPLKLEAWYPRLQEQLIQQG